MIGKQGISLPDFNAFLNKAMERLNVRTGGYDCTMYGGMCGAGMDNIFYANGKIFICGNCIVYLFNALRHTSKCSQILSLRLTEAVVSRRCLLVEDSIIWNALCRQKYIDG